MPLRKVFVRRLNGACRPSTGSTYLLYRAAELTVRESYDWFLIVDRLSAGDTQTYVDPDPFYCPWYGSGYGYWRPPWRFYRGGGREIRHRERGGGFLGTGDLRTVEQLEAQAEIVMGRGADPGRRGERAFGAGRIMVDLGPTIERLEARRPQEPLPMGSG